MKSFLTSGLVLIVVLVAAAPAFPQAGAQWRPERPNRGIYASGTDQAAQVLTVNGSAGSGYDTSAQIAAGGTGISLGNPLASEGSRYNGFAGSLSYSATLDKWSLGGSFSSSARQYPQLDVPMIIGNSASGGATFALGRRTTIHGNVGTTFSRMRNFSPFASLGDPALGQIEPPNLDFGYGNTTYHTLTVDGGFTQQFSTRSSLEATYSRSSNSFQSNIQDMTHQTGAFRYTHSLSRYLSLRLGYGQTDARYGITERQYQTHNFDIGVDYRRALSLTRRTNLSFNTGATALQTGATATQQASQTRFDVIGSAALTREIGRTWNASLVYQRSAGYAEFILEPIFSDAISASYGGQINRRLSFHSGVGTSRGTVGFNGTTGNGFDAINASAGLSHALTRNLALDLNYSLYHYNFEPGAALVSGLVPRMNRHSINVTLSAWAPIFQHGVKKHASR